MNDKNKCTNAIKKNVGKIKNLNFTIGCKNYKHKISNTRKRELAIGDLECFKFELKIVEQWRILDFVFYSFQFLIYFFIDNKDIYRKVHRDLPPIPCNTKTTRKPLKNTLTERTAQNNKAINKNYVINGK